MFGLSAILATSAQAFLVVGMPALHQVPGVSMLRERRDRRSARRVAA
jgi:hypothetical protein